MAIRRREFKDDNDDIVVSFDEDERNIIVQPNKTFDTVRARAEDFQGAELSGSSFQRCGLVQCNFTGADLENCDFRNSILTGCTFQRADLKGADFRRCDLRECDFRDAELNGATFDVTCRLNWLSHDLLAQVLYVNATTLEQAFYSSWLRYQRERCYGKVRNHVLVTQADVDRLKPFTYETFFQFLKSGDEIPARVAAEFAQLGHTLPDGVIVLDPVE